MSMCYWICQGIGIRANQLRPFLNTQKCVQLLKEQLPGEEISEDGFDIDAYLYGEPFENLADVFTFCDDTDSLTYGLLTRGSGQKMSHQALRKSMSALSKPSSVSAT